MDLPMREHYFYEKDRVKAKPANKFIGRGTLTSSTNWYATNLPKEIVNCGQYEDTDIVFISAEGNRPKRQLIDIDEITLAANANVRFITDNTDRRNSNYNVGEREVAQLLTSLGYTSKDYPQGALWSKKK
ncbi:MAG: hypothetical protein [Podoviridae sp. ctLUJ1]|nr:MAG: hypothetical protein [Podoviridae sp. ctLUJ1]